MADMTENSYRQEVNRFRDQMSRAPEGRREPRATYRQGAGWYEVMAEPGLKLYCQMKDLYLTAFQNAHGIFKFYGLPNPKFSSWELQRWHGGGVINAAELEFTEKYNKDGRVPGLGFSQTDPVRVTLSDLNDALAVMASASFSEKDRDQQRRAVGRVVIGLIEAARFNDVENNVIAGTMITDRRWKKHADQTAVMISFPG